MKMATILVYPNAAEKKSYTNTASYVIDYCSFGIVQYLCKIETFYFSQCCK